MNIWKKLDLEKALNTKIEIDRDYFGKIEFNSKQIIDNDIFIALKEGIGDGHNYVEDALERGASLAIVERYIGKNKDQQILVDNSLAALYSLAEYKRHNRSAKIIAITGSVGKTSFKEILKHILKKFGMVFSSYKNFNNYIGVPLNLASMPDKLDYAIFEVGMSNANEIRQIVKILKPDIGIITSIAPVHIENFDSIKSIVDAKLEIFDYFNIKTGIAIIPGDSEYFPYMKETLKNKKIENIYSFGSKKGIGAQHYNYIQSFNNASFNISISGKQYLAMTSLVGKHQASNITGAIFAASLFNIDIQEALDSIKAMTPVEGRGNIINVNFHGKNMIVINDCYNASPESLKASLTNYKYLDSKNKALIIGDMKELGKNAVKFHEDLENNVIESGATIVITIGPLMKYLYDKLVKTDITCFYFVDCKSAIAKLNKILSNSDSILIKASNSMKLNDIVEYLKNS